MQHNFLAIENGLGIYVSCNIRDNCWANCFPWWRKDPHTACGNVVLASKAAVFKDSLLSPPLTNSLLLKSYIFIQTIFIEKTKKAQKRTQQFILMLFKSQLHIFVSVTMFMYKWITVRIQGNDREIRYIFIRYLCHRWSSIVLIETELEFLISLGKWFKKNF